VDGDQGNLSRGISVETVVTVKSIEIGSSPEDSYSSPSNLGAVAAALEFKLPSSPPSESGDASGTEDSKGDSFNGGAEFTPTRPKSVTIATPNSPSSPSSDADDVEQERNWTMICNSINALAGCLEEPELAKTVQEALAAIPKEDTLNEQAVVSSVMTKHLLGTRTHRVFQAITQTVLAPSIMRIKFEVLNKLGTFMDVRDDDGWRVVVHLTNHGYISIDHIRKEQTCEWPISDPNHYKVEWEMSMRFDVNMETMRSCMLKINAVEMHPEIPACQRDKISAVLAGGPMIL